MHIYDPDVLQGTVGMLLFFWSRLLLFCSAALLERGGLLSIASLATGRMKYECIFAVCMPAAALRVSR